MIERTLVAIKPDALMRGVVGEIIARFEKVGLKLIAADMRRPDKDFFHKHYEDIGTMITRHGQKIFDITLDMIMAGPVLAMVFEGADSIELVRKITGATVPAKALPGTIRGDFSHIGMDHANDKDKPIFNLLHASANKEEAEKELKLWFPDGKFMEYKRVDEDLMM